MGGTRLRLTPFSIIEYKLPRQGCNKNLLFNNNIIVHLLFILHMLLINYINIGMSICVYEIVSLSTPCSFIPVYNMCKLSWGID